MQLDSSNVEKVQSTHQDGILTKINRRCEETENHEETSEAYGVNPEEDYNVHLKGTRYHRHMPIVLRRFEILQSSNVDV